jgi:hypothetical protein
VDTAAIIAELEAERDRFNSALAALQGRTSSHGRGRIATATFIDGRKRHMSAAAKKRISDAMKKKWAARKKAA